MQLLTNLVQVTNQIFSILFSVVLYTYLTHIKVLILFKLKNLSNLFIDLNIFLYKYKVHFDAKIFIFIC